VDLLVEIGDEGLGIRGMSMAVLGTRFVAHFAAESVEDERAMVGVLAKL